MEERHCHTPGRHEPAMAKQRKGRTLIITDDEAIEAEELNPFSFNEFLRLKKCDQEEEPSQGEEPEESSGGGAQHPDQVQHVSVLLSREDGAAGGDRDQEISANEGEPFSRRYLQEENAALRRSLEELRSSVAKSQRRASQLTEELRQARRKEQEEAQDLESMVQSVEHNLRLMTRRAVKAENSVSKLKSDLQQLQAELVRVRSENSRLKAAESQVVMTMRQNAHLASEYLKKTTSHAHSSLQQLLAEAESLSLVSQLLSSIDKISAVDTES